LAALERDEVKRQQWRDDLQAKPADAYVFIDESSTHLTMTPLYARSAKGQRAFGVVPRKRGTNITLIAALSQAGMNATMTLEGSLDGEAFEVYVKKVLVPTLRPGQTIILDNLRVHENVRAHALIEQAGCSVRFLPAYSPDLMPIEPGFSKVKSLLRSLGARTMPAFDKAVSLAVNSVSANDAIGFFKHCGYTLSAQPL
jgi:transposase